MVAAPPRSSAKFVEPLSYCEYCREAGKLWSELLSNAAAASQSAGSYRRHFISVILKTSCKD